MLAPVRTTSSMPATTTTGSATDGATASTSTAGATSSTATTANSTPTTAGAATAASAAASTASNAALTESAPASPLSGGRYGLLSLSGQLQMAQGVSAIADAIGQALQMPRGDNEALQDYAARLATAVSAMSTAERQDLEATINQSVSGTSLRMLADLLRSPAGPDAARLTAYLQAALTDGADPDQVMRAVLSAYQQDAASDAVLPRQNLPGAAGMTQAGPGSGAGAGTAPQANMPAGMPTAGQATPGAGSAAASADGPEGLPGATNANAAPAAPTASPAEGRQGAQVAGLAQQNANASGGGAGAAGGGAANAAGSGQAQAAGGAASATPAGMAGMTSMAGMAGITGRGADATLQGDLAAQAATSPNTAGSQAAGGGNPQTFLAGLATHIRNFGQGLSGTLNVPPAPNPIAADLLPASEPDFPDAALADRTPVSTGLSQVIASRPDTLATIEWLATALAGNTLPGLIAALAAHNRGSVVDDFIARLIAGGLAMGSSDTGHLMAQAKAMAAPPDPQTTGSIADDPDLPQILAEARPHASTAGREDVDGLPLPLSPQMQAAQAREGFVFPYVTYPPLDQPPQRRPRRPTIEISAVDEDGEHPQQPGEEAFDDDDRHEDEQEDGGAGAQSDADSHPLAATGTTDGPGNGASDTASAAQSASDSGAGAEAKPAGKRAAPTAHLADSAERDDDLPHDLYFKMAGWK